MQNENILLILLAVFLLPGNVLAQFSNSGTINNRGGIIDNYPFWHNTEDGIYSGSDDGIFNHHGPASLTFINDGIYQAGAGHTDVFKGPGAEEGTQHISGSKRPYFYNLVFDNGPGSEINIVNTEGISVAGALTFQNGITTTLRSLHHTAAIHFEEGGGYTNGNTDEQHVNGYVSQKGSAAFVFPVGSGTSLRTLEISAPALATAEISVAWLPGNPTVTADPSDVSPYHPTTSVNTPITTVSNIGQWDWIAVSPPGNALTVTVTLPDVSGFASATNLRLVGWDGEKWIDLSGAATASGNTANNTLSGTVPSGANITALGIGSISEPLPVTLLSFEAAIAEEREVLLSWRTVQEVDNDHFLLEHAIDAENFNPVGIVKSSEKRIVSGVNHYHFRHRPDTPFGVHYYRLKQVDRAAGRLDGAFTYSEIRSVDFKQPYFRVHPNPSSEILHVQVHGWEKIQSIALFDALGRNFYESAEKKPVSVLQTTRFPAGVYFVRVRFDDDTLLNQKVIITK